MADETYVHKLRRVSTHSYALTMPKELMDAFGWRERQKLEIRRRGNEIVIKDWSE